MEAINILFIIHMLVYWGLSLGFLLSDFYLHTKGLIIKYKYSSVNNLNFKQYTNSVKTSLFSQFVVLYPMMWLSTFVIHYENYDYHLFFDSLKLIGAIFIEEILFYYGHRLLHHPKLYKDFHSLHHELINVMASGTLYASVVEDTFINFLPLFIIVYLTGMNYYTTIIWVIVSTVSAVLSHCGYRLGGISQRHDLHHKLFNCNYGVIGLLDWFHNTQYKDLPGPVRRRVI